MAHDDRLDAVDPLLSFLIGLLVLRSAWFLVKESAHARIVEDASPDSAITGIRAYLDEHFGIDHVTVQTELESCADGPATASG